MPADQRAKALTLAGETLAKANVSATWIDCAHESEDRAAAGLLERLTKGDIVLRIQHHLARGPHILDTAVVQDGGPNVLASVYAESVAARSAKTGLPRSVILGRVTAHDRPPAARHQQPRANRPDARVLESADPAPERVAVHRGRCRRDPLGVLRRGEGEAAAGRHLDE